jgi:AraC-like DNA-binding protein
MEQARRLLSREKQGLTVRETASLVGYRKSGGLRQAFLRFYGENPSAVQSLPPDYSELWKWRERTTPQLAISHQKAHSKALIK